MLSVGMLLKKGMKGQIDLMSAVMQAATKLGSDQQNNVVTGTLADEIQLIHNFKQLFLLLVGNAVQKYGDKLDQQQQVLLALSDILIEVYFAESSLLRTLKNTDRDGQEAQELQQAMVQHYVFEAHNTVLKKAKEVIFSISKDDEQKQLLNVLNRSCTYKNYPNIVTVRTKIADRFIHENSYFL